MFSLKSSVIEAFAVPLGVLSRKNVTGDNVLSLRGEKVLKPCPQSTVLVPLGIRPEKLQDLLSADYFVCRSPMSKTPCWWLG